MRYLGFILPTMFIAYLATGITLVRPGERAVIRRFGRVLDQKPGPGLHLGLPWGMDRVDRVPVDMVRRVTVGYQRDSSDTGSSLPPGQLLTGDRNLVNVEAVINYAIKPDDESVVDYVLQAQQADDLVARTAESVLTEWMAASKVDAVLLGDKTALRQRLMDETQARLEPYRLGIRIQAANIGYLAPPDEVKDAFDDVTRAHTDIDRLINEERALADEKVQNAQANKVRDVQAARARAEDVARQRDVELRAFDKLLALYQQSGKQKGEFLRLIWHEEMAKLAAHMTGRIEMLDDRLNSGGLEITTFAPKPPKK